jgi:RNA polymerase sigma-70 factor (ECF subfamily)
LLEEVDERRISNAAATHSPLERLGIDPASRAAMSSVPVSFEQLYLDYFDFTYRTLRHLGVPGSALPDAAQEVWLAVHRQLSRFEVRSTHRTWLFSIALNTARNHHRWRRRHERRAAPLHDDLPDERPQPDEARADAEALRLVQEFLVTLDEPHRVLFISQFLEELSAEETAELLGIQRSTVYHRVRDLRRTFKRWVLSKQGAAE